MAKMNILLCCLSLFLCLVVCSGSEQSKWAEKQADKTWRVAKGRTWCVAKISAPKYKLQRFLDECCSQLDCGPIKPGGRCYDPNTYQNHGSYALDLWFRVRGECRSDIGTPAVTDPSWGPCKYP